MGYTVLTLAVGADFRKALAPSLESKRAWCERHGYKYVQAGEEMWDRSRPISWSKVRFALSVLRDLSDGEFVFSSDADSMITNPDLRLEDEVAPLLPEGKDLLMAIDACGHLNAGQLLFRNTPWLRDFLERVDKQTDLTYHIWWENSAMIRLFETNPTDLAHAEFTPQHWKFNAYIQGLAGQKLWEPGMLLVHFAGIYDLEKMKEYQAEILRGGVPRTGQVIVG